MTKSKQCPWCGGSHRKKKEARKCYDRHNPPKWSKKEIGR